MEITPEEAKTFLKRKGRSSNKRRSVALEEKALYSDMLKDRNGYIVDKEYKPPVYELVKLKLKDNKSIYGWWTGTVWEGRRHIDNALVKCWKRKDFMN